MYWYHLFLLVWLWLLPDVESVDDIPVLAQSFFVTLSSAVLLSTVPDVFGSFGGESGLHHKAPKASIKRVRRSVCDIFAEFGKTYVRRAYRMDESTFWRLCRI
jgi:hypothetical protein